VEPSLFSIARYITCRSELAREKLTGAAFIQEARVIVNVFREQARSYRSAAFERQGHALAAADAQRRQTFLGVALDHFMQQGHQHAAT